MKTPTREACASLHWQSPATAEGRRWSRTPYCGEFDVSVQCASSPSEVTCPDCLRAMPDVHWVDAGHLFTLCGVDAKTVSVVAVRQDEVTCDACRASVVAQLLRRRGKTTTVRAQRPGSNFNPYSGVRTLVYGCCRFVVGTR